MIQIQQEVRQVLERALQQRPPRGLRVSRPHLSEMASHQHLVEGRHYWEELKHHVPLAWPLDVSVFFALVELYVQRVAYCPQGHRQQLPFRSAYQALLQSKHGSSWSDEDARDRRSNRLHRPPRRFGFDCGFDGGCQESSTINRQGHGSYARGRGAKARYSNRLSQTSSKALKAPAVSEYLGGVAATLSSIFGPVAAKVPSFPGTVDRLKS